MHTQNILLVSLLVALSGCQPEAPVQQAAVPEAPAAMQAPVATEHAEHAEHAGQPAASEAPAPVQPAASVAAGKPGQPAAAEKPAQAAPAPAAAAPAAKVEPAAVEARPAMQAEPAVSEADAMQLAKKSNCLACHAIDKKVVGPAWKDVAAKYRGDAGAEVRMMDKIAKGGSGVWGVMVMPPSPQVSEADRRTLARFVLSLK